MSSQPLYEPPELSGRVALVAGATRGVGRGAALALGKAGATVYCTGRSTRANRQPRSGKNRHSPFDHSRRPETVEETAHLVTAAGGKGVAVVLDHTRADRVETLLTRIRKEQGQLHILVNDISELVPHDLGKPFWELNLPNGFKNLRNVLDSQILTGHFAAPLLAASARGSKRPALMVGIGDGDFYTYRGHLFYDLIKTSIIRLAFSMARELRGKNVAALALTPGFLRSEAMLEKFGVTERNWREALVKDPHYAASETPLYAGRAVAALASDPELMQKSGRVFSSWGLAAEYGFCDADGSRPDWGRYFTAQFGDCLKSCDEAFYQSWKGGPIDLLFGEWPA